MSNLRTYSELIQFPEFLDRYEYLRLFGSVGEDTFGFDRIFSQMFYKSREWKQIRSFVITRDLGCDLGCKGYDIHSRIYIHHMNPISMDDITNQTEFLLNPEYLITTTFDTHNAIHYGDSSLLVTGPIERTKNDTCPWKEH